MGSVALGLPSLRRTGAMPADRPQDHRLVDRFGRVATDLRVSLTDRCNLRCSYCMPAEGLDWLPDDRVLTDDEVVRLITVAVERLGVEEVRFTGGGAPPRPGGGAVVAAATTPRTGARGGPPTTGGPNTPGGPPPA